ncbi:hypothetical protein YB2330_003203 [Saitoella coloradoensis]
MPSSSPDFKISNLFDVKGLKVLVIGGGTGIGLMIARALAVNGAKVYITGRREDVLKSSAEQHGAEAGVQGEIIPITGDVTDKTSIQALLDELKQKEEYLDILINNSGIAGPGIDNTAKEATPLAKSMWENDYDEALSVFKVNVLGYYFVSAAFIPLLNKSPNHPQIINITSNAAFGREAMAGILYSCTKAASTHLTKMLATHLSGTNIRVNAIAPGLFPSELTAGDSGKDNRSDLKGDTQGIDIPTGRPGTEEEMATTVLYLANKKQTYTSGSVVFIDGGVLTRMPSTY